MPPFNLYARNQQARGMLLTPKTLEFQQMLVVLIVSLGWNSISYLFNIYLCYTWASSSLGSLSLCILSGATVFVAASIWYGSYFDPSESMHDAQ